ncbi:MAG: hypothetical protein ACLFUJ_02995 [Phycisphaerae bacterium]
MSIPTFAGMPLFDEAAGDRPASAEIRIQTQHMPGVDGEFVLRCGTGGRDIQATGRISVTGATAIEAHQALKASLGEKQQAVNGRTVASYVGTDGVEYPWCMVRSLEMTDPVEISRLSADSVLASCRCRAMIRQLSQ